MENSFWSRRRWLSRLSVSFLIVAAWLFYLGYQGGKNHTFSQGRIVLCYISAFLSFSLFLLGTRERHRPGPD
jgi:hypothetical protein